MSTDYWSRSKRVLKKAGEKYDVDAQIEKAVGKVVAGRACVKNNDCNSDYYMLLEDFPPDTYTLAPCVTSNLIPNGGVKLVAVVDKGRVKTGYFCNEQMMFKDDNGSYMFVPVKELSCETLRRNSYGKHFRVYADQWE